MHPAWRKLGTPPVLGAVGSIWSKCVGTFVQFPGIVLGFNSGQSTRGAFPGGSDGEESVCNA